MSPFDPARWPERLPGRYWLGGVQVPAQLLDAPGSLQPAPPVCTLALLIEGGRIAAIEPRAPGGAATFDLDGAFALPAFTDLHTHLDKGDLLAAGLDPERDLFAAVDRVRADYARWTEAELRARIGFALRTAYAHGTRAINTYVDWPDPGAPEGPLAWRVMQQLKPQWAGRVELQITSLASIDRLADRQVAETLARNLAAGGGALGLFVYPGAPLQWLPRAFDLAGRHGLALDFHIDEHLEPPVANIGHVARLARERGVGRRTVCAHACVLGTLPDGDRDRLLDEIAASGLTLVSLPYTNLYLQDNGVTAGGTRRTPRRRGLLPWHEARARGIPLALASDNHRDVFFPGGDLDLLQALALAANAAQLDDALVGWADTVTTTPARFLGGPRDGRLRVGAPADLVLHAGRTSTEVLSRPQFGRQVLRAGQRLNAADATPPDFRELSRELRPQRARSLAHGPAQGTAPRAAA
ncbi:MAG: amidohydrolase family protein [Rubrivivax sp.]|nr:amidohydrolase family protein [Rubrivivax sp.]